VYSDPAGSDLRVRYCRQRQSGWSDGGDNGRKRPRYSGADKQHWTVMPSLQVRKGAFFFDSTKGIGYDLQTDNGLYFENAFGYSFGRADQNSSWRDGSDKLKGMGNIRGALNTQVAVGWQVNSWFTRKSVQLCR
jgi:outer membrane scaffolding protein for murein synthesis (MipA/OmpV family)